MAEEYHNKHQSPVAEEIPVESTDRGLFDFLKKDEEKPQEEVIVGEFEKVKVSEPKEEEKKHSLLEKLHRSDSGSSSSSDEEEDEEKKKKKKEKKKKEEEKKEEHVETSVPVEKYEEVVHTESLPPPLEEKKGFLEKMKDKLPGKKTEEVPPPSHPEVECVPEPTPVVAEHEGEGKEKKGLLEKIKEKLPGYHHKSEEEKKEKE